MLIFASPLAKTHQEYARGSDGNEDDFCRAHWVVDPSVL
jgi:hypothetical protein